LSQTPETPFKLVDSDQESAYASAICQPRSPDEARLLLCPPDACVSGATSGSATPRQRRFVTPMRRCRTASVAALRRPGTPGRITVTHEVVFLGLAKVEREVHVVPPLVVDGDEVADPAVLTETEPLVQRHRRMVVAPYVERQDLDTGLAPVRDQLLDDTAAEPASASIRRHGHLRNVGVGFLGLAIAPDPVRKSHDLQGHGLAADGLGDHQTCVVEL